MFVPMIDNVVDFHRANDVFVQNNIQEKKHIDKYGTLTLLQ